MEDLGKPSWKVVGAFEQQVPSCAKDVPQVAFCRLVRVQAYAKWMNAVFLDFTNGHGAIEDAVTFPILTFAVWTTVADNQENPTGFGPA